MKISLRILLTLILFSLFQISYGMVPTKNGNLIDVYIDCPSCDINYIRTEITFVNYVLDRKNADLHILVTRQTTGSDGREYTISFIGRKSFKNKNDTLSFFTRPDNSDDEIRREMVKYFKIGLMRYIAQTAVADAISISYKYSEENKPILVDPWNYWVFRTRLRGYFRGEESYQATFLNASIDINRITEDWKFKFSAGTHYSESVFTFDDSDYSSFSRGNYSDILLIKSISDNWSVGVTGDFGSSTYANYKFYGQLFPAIEYDIYPYSESTRKIFRMLYKIGYGYAQYNEVTIYDKLEEGKFIQFIEIAMELKQPWGTVEATIEGSNYFYDFSKNRLQARLELSLRLFKGFTFDIDGRYAFIHDQLNLAKSDISDEEVLLRRRQLETQYEFWSSVGISYTFGSIYNNIVNPRFGN